MESAITLISRLRLLSGWILLTFVLFLPLSLLPEDLPDLVTITLICVFVLLLFTLPLRFAQYRLKVNFSYGSILIGDQSYNWSEVKSYSAESSQYFETLTIKLYHGKKIQLTGFTDGKKSKQFQRLKNLFIQIVDYHNQRGEINEIKKAGFYSTQLAKLFIVIMGFVALIGIFAFILGKLKNPVPLLMLLGILGFMIAQVFKKRRTNANKK